MKNIVFPIKYCLFVAFIISMGSCKQNDLFIQPIAKMAIVNSSISLKEKLEIKNQGAGQKFVFWPGDDGHNFNLRSYGNNYGLEPNAGMDFTYYYSKPGEYTVVMIASSYDALTDNFVQKFDSTKISVAGSTVNNFTSFAIQNAYTAYSPQGIIFNDSILIKVVPVLYPTYPDSTLAFIINKDLPLFTVADNMDFVTVMDEFGNTYKGAGGDLNPLKLFTIITKNVLQPNVRTFTVIDNITQNAHDYKVAALIYPEIYSLSVDGSKAILFSKDGINVDPAVPWKTDKLGNFILDSHYKKIADTISYYHIHADSLYYGVFIFTDPGNVTPRFSVPADCIVSYKGAVVTSGVTKIDLTNQPAILNITRTYGGFTITTKVAINYTAF